MADNRAQYVNNSDDFQILSTTPTANSGFIDVSQYAQWSVFVSGLEAAGTVKVELANGPVAPASGIVAATISPDANGNGSFDTVKPYHWVRVSKTQGTTPTLTTVALCGQRAV